MKRTTKQLNAIGYAYARARRAKAQKEMEALNINLLFEYQTQWKTPNAFINGVKAGKLNIKKLRQTLDKRQGELSASRAPSWHFEELAKVYEQLNNLNK